MEFLVRVSLFFLTSGQHLPGKVAFFYQILKPSWRGVDSVNKQSTRTVAALDHFGLCQIAQHCVSLGELSSRSGVAPFLALPRR